ncbi:Xaa-Pro aminopeptidase [Alphaproteobacteria bacterium]|nr:Xaa-Pro aminopeptidase [Alphaproteobacteria bacterium]
MEFSLPEGADALFLRLASPHNTLCGHDVSVFVRDVSGFTGSAALLVWGPAVKTLFVDPRYTLQAKAECPQFDIRECTSLGLEEPMIKNWIQALGGSRCWAYDPSNISVAYFKKMKDLFPFMQWIPCSCPAAPDEQTREKEGYRIPQDRTYAEKRAFILQKTQEFLAQKGLPLQKKWGLLITSPESIAWLTNLRAKHWAASGSCSPTFPSLFLLTPQKSFLLAPPPPAPCAEDGALAFEYCACPPSEFGATLAKTLASEPLNVLLFQASQMPQQLFERMPPPPALQTLDCPDACLAARSMKSPAEIASAKSIHFWEGLAIVRLMAWLRRQQKVTEHDIAQKLEQLRKKCALYRGPSFASIVASGPHAAIVHYGPRATHPSPVQDNVVLLMDVGGHYEGGTTDMTRTLWRGPNPPPQNIMQTYTRVLKGLIALNLARFPEGTTGAQLDAFARQFLWQAGQDYAHGTGHGVGNYLAVHEGAFSVSPRGGAVPLEAGMILSNEPGFYKEGDFGIRLENLQVVVGEKFLSFETLTLAPFDAQLVDFSMLTAEEKAWLKVYHQIVCEKFKDVLSSEGESDGQEELEKNVQKFLNGEN